MTKRSFSDTNDEIFYQPDLRLFTTLIERDIKNFLIEQFKNKYKKLSIDLINILQIILLKLQITMNKMVILVMSSLLIYNKINVFNKIYNL